MSCLRPKKNYTFGPTKLLPKFCMLLALEQCTFIVSHTFHFVRQPNDDRTSEIISSEQVSFSIRLAKATQLASKMTYECRCRLSAVGGARYHPSSKWMEPRRHLGTFSCLQPTDTHTHTTLLASRIPLADESLLRPCWTRNVLHCGILCYGMQYVWWKCGLRE